MIAAVKSETLWVATFLLGLQYVSLWARTDNSEQYWPRFSKLEEGRKNDLAANFDCSTSCPVYPTDLRGDM